MAYSARVQTFPVADGFVITVHEIDAASASEAGPIPVPVRGTIVRVRSQLVSGTGTRVAPSIGRAKNWSAGDFNEVRPGTDHELDAVPYFAPDGVLYLRSGVDTGADNEIRTEILIRAIGLAGG